MWYSTRIPWGPSPRFWAPLPQCGRLPLLTSTPGILHTMAVLFDGHHCPRKSEVFRLLSHRRGKGKKASTTVAGFCVLVELTVCKSCFQAWGTASLGQWLHGRLLRAQP